MGQYVAEELKKMKVSLSVYELLKRPEVRTSFFQVMGVGTKIDYVQKENVTKDNVDKGKERVHVTDVEQKLTLYKDKRESPPLLLTLRIFNRNLHNCLVDFGASTNIMPLSVCKALGLTLAKSSRKVTQLDKTEVNVVGELNKIHMQLASDLRVQQ